MGEHRHLERRKSCPHTWQEARRTRASARTPHGWNPGEMAAALGVSPAAVSPWRATVRAHGRAAGRATSRPTGPLTLPDDHWRRIPALFSQGAEAYGVRGEGWTWARVAMVMAETCGVRYHTAPVSRVWQRVHWTPQRPLERAVHRDAALIEPWRLPVWPQRNNRRTSKAGPSCGWTSRGLIAGRGPSAQTRPADRHRSCGGPRHAISSRE